MSINILKKTFQSTSSGTKHKKKEKDILLLNFHKTKFDVKISAKLFMMLKVFMPRRELLLLNRVLLSETLI